MSGPLVVATLAGLKTHTCRPLTLPPKVRARGPILDKVWYSSGSGEFPGGNPKFTPGQEPHATIRCSDRTSQFVSCPFGTVEDRLWVRETWAPADEWDKGYPLDEPVLVGYRADGKVMNCETPESKWLFYGWKDFAPWFNGHGGKWRPSIHMARWASRIMLEVTEVSVFRVQSATHSVLLREGIWLGPDDPTEGVLYARWQQVWTGIYGPESWAANPWVWGIGFKLAKP